MRLRFLVFSVLVSGFIGCQCGGKASPCDTTRCSDGLVCDPDTGKCVSEFAGTGGSGNGAGGGSGNGAGGGGSSNIDSGAPDSGAACPVTCSGITPICDSVNMRCVGCTTTEGCGGTTPICDTNSNGGFGKCVTCTITDGCSGLRPYCDPTIRPAGGCNACRTSVDCAGGLACDDTGECVIDDGGFGGGGGGSGGGSGNVIFDGGSTAHCMGTGGGGMACHGECPNGYQCVGGQCVLHGSSGPVQVTLRFNQPEDLDLHLVEPLRDGGQCEIFYGNVNTGPILPFQTRCGAQTYLDLDSNAACAIDNVDVENIISPPGTTATSGKYTVRVDYYQNCSAFGQVPYEVEVRANGVTRYFCGSFSSSAANGGGVGSGVLTTTFVIP